MENPATWNDIMRLLNSREFKSAEDVMECLEKNGHWRAFHFDTIDEALKFIEGELFIDDPEDPRHFGSLGSRLYWGLKKLGAVE